MEAAVATDIEQAEIAPLASTLTYGVDVSHWKHPLDWKQAYQLGKRFVSAKTTDGRGVVEDDRFEIHRWGSKAAGLLFCPFHFFRYDPDPKDQADHFMKFAGTNVGELPPMIDCEWDNNSSNKLHHSPGGHMDNAFADRLYIFKERVKELSGMPKLFLYTSFYFFRGFDHPERFADCIPWVAAYGTSLNRVRVPLPWKAPPALWQYTDHEKSGDQFIDADVYNGPFSELQALVRK